MRFLPFLFISTLLFTIYATAQITVTSEPFDWVCGKTIVVYSDTTIKSVTVELVKPSQRLLISTQVYEKYFFYTIPPQILSKNTTYIYHIEVALINNNTYHHYGCFQTPYNPQNSINYSKIVDMLIHNLSIDGEIRCQLENILYDIQRNASYDTYAYYRRGVRNTLQWVVMPSIIISLYIGYRIRPIISRFRPKKKIKREKPYSIFKR